MKRTLWIFLALLVLFFIARNSSRAGFDGRPYIPNNSAEKGRKGPLANLFLPA